MEIPPGGEKGFECFNSAIAKYFGTKVKKGERGSPELIEE